MQNLALVLSCIGTLCWIVCFWWMHRISARQNATLEELHEMTARIEKLSRAEHDLISPKEVERFDLLHRTLRICHWLTPIRSAPP